MARQPIDLHAGSRLRAIVVLLLAHSGYERLLLGLPRLWIIRHRTAPANPLTGELRPYRRRLWRQRAVTILARFLALAMLYLIAANLLVLVAVSGLPSVLRWGPAALLVLAGIWLTAVHRPGLDETALLLDRQFKLREELGTALEYDPARMIGALAPQQLANALHSLRALPRNPWRARRSAPWLLTVVLLVVAALSNLLITRGGPGAVTAVAADQSTRTSAGNTSLAQVAPNQSPLTSQAPAVLPLQQSRSGASHQPAVTRQPILATSLQIRQGPRLAESAGATGDAPGVLANNLNGGSGAGANGKGSANGPSGTARQYGSTGNNGQSGQPGSGQNQGGQGGTPGNNPGAGSGQGNQQPQTGPQNSLGQSSMGTVGSQNGGSNQGQSNQPGGQPPTGTQNGAGPNPFGQDPAATKPNSTGKQNGSANAGSGKRQSGNRTTPSSQSSTQHGNGQSSNSANSRGGPDDALRQNRHGSTNPDLGKQPTAPTGKAGPARGKQITLGGRPIVSDGNQGPELVRVVPFSAASGPGLNGPSGGSATVEGYVPEDDMTLAPDEQALVRAYFGNGSGS
jgi:hypothetical protein